MCEERHHEGTECRINAQKAFFTVTATKCMLLAKILDVHDSYDVYYHRCWLVMENHTLVLVLVLAPNVHFCRMMTVIITLTRRTVPPGCCN